MASSGAPPLLGPLTAAGADRPDAVTIAGRCLSTAGLLDAAGALAARLAGAGPVALDATPTAETVVGVLAGLLAGVPVVPVPADAGVGELGHLLADSGASLLLGAADRLQALARPGGPEVLPIDTEARWGGALPSEPPASAPALILYTSGTTGPPKGVVLSRRAIAADLDALAEAWDWSAGDTVVHGLPLFHVHGLVLGLLGPLRLGGRVVHVGRPTPDAYAAAVGDGATMCFGVPTVWSRIASSPAVAGLRPARLLVSGSAGLPVAAFEALCAASGHRPVERYGMTETLITLSTRAGGERRAGTVGAPLRGMEARVVDEDGSPVTADGEAIGSLQVRTPTLMDGYLGQPAASAACFTPDGWFVTGDVATVDVDGSHRIVGRASTDLIKTGGYRVGAGEVEAALLRHPGVREAAVVGERDADLGAVIVAYVVADPTHPPTPDGLVAFVAGELSGHKRPRRVELVDSLPRNALGKVQKARLQRP